MGAFILVIAILILVSVAPLHLLYSEMALKQEIPITSRLPVLEPHEQVKFNFSRVRVQEDEDDDDIPDAYRDERKVQDDPDD